MPMNARRARKFYGRCWSTASFQRAPVRLDVRILFGLATPRARRQSGSAGACCKRQGAVAARCMVASVTLSAVTIGVNRGCSRRGAGLITLGVAKSRCAKFALKGMRLDPPDLIDIRERISSAYVHAGQAASRARQRQRRRDRHATDREDGDPIDGELLVEDELAPGLVEAMAAMAPATAMMPTHQQHAAGFQLRLLHAGRLASAQSAGVWRRQPK